MDYRKLRFSNLNTEEFRHLKLLLYWPIFGILFLFAERGYTPDSYITVYCALDDKIPFNELFLIPYLFWFVFLAGSHIYTLLYDVETFKKLMNFIIITYSVALIIYFLFPTCQELRPVVFERDNLLTRFMAGFYQFDTNTNVCPSLHVVGSLAAMFACWESKGLQKPVWKITFGITAFLICISTVFLKQHSVLDILMAVPLCIAGYYFSFARRRAEELSFGTP